MTNTIIRKFFCFVTAAIVTALALPTFAQQSQNKYYTLNMSVPVQGQSGAPSKVQAVIKNVSPTSSNSTFNSVDLYLVDLQWTVMEDPPFYSVTVEQSGTATKPWTVDLTQDGHIKISNLYPVKPQETVTITFYVDQAFCGDATWNADVWSGANIGSGNIFSRPKPDPSFPVATVSCEGLACSSTPEVAYGENVVATRWTYNKDGTTAGTTCSAVNTYVSNTSATYSTTLAPNIVHVRWDLAKPNQTFSSAVFSYVVTYASPISSKPGVGWLYTDGSPATNPGADPNADPGNPVAFITPAPDCLSNTPPTPYGNLQTSLTAMGTTVKVDTSTGISSVPTLPFPIVIGTERMQVTAISSNGWTVSRAAGGTTAAKHPKDALVMSTPLPILAETMSDPDPPAPYKRGSQAQMCLWKGWEPSTTATFFDIGDGWSQP